ncbi:MAG: sulfurtransferase TusA family protein [Parvularculaceae bacterium]|nr:sulfurtransferase TusA family protein [Parvularculaceae bacterium]
MTTQLDLTGLRCPLPVIRLEAAMRKAEPGAVIIASADDPIARVDIPHAARQAGFSCEETAESTNSTYVFRVIAPQR